ncbi:MAG TPA: hypothetical protein VE242_04650, partial [Chthoniobacterales bacterium]|nr:hypothetical protein [Chthoniobacterales bacterium]
MIVRSIELSQGYNELNNVIVYHLSKLLGLGESKEDLSVIFDFFALEISLEPTTRWQREAFLEWYAHKTDLNLNVLLNKIVRETSVVPFDSSLIGVSPRTVQMPPLAVPLVPVSQRDSELTVVSWVPGLETLLCRPEFELLNEFWGIRR